MPKASPTYTTFTSGEISPFLQGRTDLDQYFKGSDTCKNLLSLQYGPLLHRPGMPYVADGLEDTTKSRLLEFIPNAEDAVVVELSVDNLGNGIFQFYTNEGAVMNAGNPSQAGNEYTEDEIFEVQYVQSNDVMTLTHKNHPPMTLQRNSPNVWVRSDYIFVGNPYLLDNVTSSKTLTCSVSAESATGTLTAVGHAPFDAGHAGTHWKVGVPVGSPAVQGFVRINSISSSTVANVIVIKELSGTSATDIWAEAAWSDFRGWPSRCTYFQNRLWFANSPAQPNGLWGSSPFIYDDFTPGTGLADEAISEIIPEVNDIKWLLGGKTLIAGTGVGDFIISAGDVGGVVTPESLLISKQTNWGSEAIQPKFIGSYGYYAQLRGRKVREIFFYFQDDTYKAVDMTAVSDHITFSGIKDMAYQRNPYSMLYCVLNNGTMAVMTREADQQSLGWTRLDTDGLYESVAVIPHPTADYDVVFVVVNRTINGVSRRYIERFEDPQIPARQDQCFYVDSGLRFDTYDATTSNALTLSGTSGTITATAGSGIFVSGDVGQRIRAIDSDGVTLGELTITVFTSSTIVTGTTTTDFSTTSYSGNDWGISVNDIAGLDHIEAETVKILLDGVPEADKTVSSGSITMGNDGFIAAIGLGYTGRWKNMPIESGSATGTSQGKKKRIYQCGFKFFRSLGMTVGGDESHLRTIVPRDVSQGQANDLFTGLVPPMSIDTTFDYLGHLVLQQDKPLPMMILSVLPLLETNDK